MSRIIVVDDEPQVRKLLKAFIEAGNHEVTDVCGGAQALDACRSAEPDLVVTDLVMPEKNGIDLILSLKEEFPKLPIVAISGGGGIVGRYDYLDIADLMGANRVLKKPISKDELLSAISTVLDQ